MRLGCPCFLLSRAQLARFADDPDLPDATREACRRTLSHEPGWREVRVAYQSASRKARQSGFMGLNTLANAPDVAVFDCKGTTSLPGRPIPDPATSDDPTARRAFEQTTRAARFLAEAFGRNSLDNAGMTLISSIHLADKLVNAYWDGSQMTYGDADGALLLDFTLAGDVIAHELAHGVTQFTAGFEYVYGEPGALNESMSDVFAIMYRHWCAKDDAATATWTIGSEIIGPAAKARGLTCMRDMADPGGAHCAAPQPDHMREFLPGGDPHANSGIPNKAFQLAARAIGGASWDRAGRIWYAAMLDDATKPDATFKDFAKRTRSHARKLFDDGPELAAVIAAWKAVGVLKS